MDEAPETRYAESSVGRVAYQTVGVGPIDLIIVPNTLMPIDLVWDEPGLVRFLARLASFSRTILFDPAGMGSSDPLPSFEGRLLETVPDSMVAVLDHLGCERVALLGLGLQAPLMFAASHPERAGALVLVNPTARIRRDVDYPGISEKAVESIIATQRQEWGTGTRILRIAPSRADDVPFRRWLGRADRLGGSLEEAVARRRDQFDVDLRPVLPTIQAPTLVIDRGRRFLPAEQSRYVADHINGARYVQMDCEDALAFAGDTGPLLDAIEEFLTGELPRHETDRILATVLFTDIVGSTEQAARLGDRRWKELQAAHDTVVSREIERHRGRQVKSMGDGVLATFDGPGRAVRCASAIRDAVRALGIGIRAGLHTGEIELRGDDVGGIAVHIGARVSALAGAGEVLVSRTVVDLVVGSGIVFADRGDHELRGVPGTWKLFAVTAE